MKRDLRRFAAAGVLLGALSVGGTALAQKQGGVLKIGQFDSPASMSILEESSNTAEGPMMGVFNNLVLYDQHVSQNSLQSIQPDLATDWSWDEDRTRLTFHLRKGVKWHDGKPFTAQDVKCTWDILGGNSTEKLRLNPRKAWYRNLQEVTTNGDYEVTFNLKRPQPALLALLASGWAPVYPCHVSPRDMRAHPIGTGPFQFVEFKPNEVIRVTRNRQYWKSDRPYLDGIEYPIDKDHDISFRSPALCRSCVYLRRDTRREAAATGDHEDCRERPGATCAIVAEIRFEGLPTRRRIVCSSRQRRQLTNCEAAADDHRDETRSGHGALPA
jgi:ABC-type transport system substrate-binding protein